MAFTSRCGVDFFIFHMLLLNVPYISIVTIPEPLSSLSTSFTNGSRPSQSHSLNQRNRLPKYSPHPYSTPIFPTTDSGSMESSLDGTFAQLGVERFSDRWYEYWSKECFNLFFYLSFLVSTIRCGGHYMWSLFLYSLIRSSCLQRHYMWRLFRFNRDS